MKITCPKCHSSYKVDLPDPGEGGIDVQCGKCLYIFLFSTAGEKSGTAEKTQDHGLLESRSSGTILPPQKDEDQGVSDSKQESLKSRKHDSPSPEKSSEALEELELEPIINDPEPIEIVVEDDGPEESLEEVALDDIWNQAVEEGARTVAKSKEKTPPPEQPVAEDEEVFPEKKSKRLPSMEDRQREIDQMIADHQNKEKESAEKASAEETQPPSSQKDPPQEKAQEEIDLEERVVIDEDETMPNWEEAFLHQSKVEDGWKKAQEQDRLHEEQQLADALGKNAPTEPTEETSDSLEDKQSLVDEVFAETRSAQESQEEAANSSESAADQKQEEVDEVTEAENQEKTDLEEQVIIDEDEVMPSWEEAFADQSTVETGWKKALEEDRKHEEQQLADALGEEYTPPEQETPAAAENKQALVDQLFEEVRSQQESPEEPGETAPSSDIQETHVGEHTIPGEIDLMTDLDDLNMKQLVTQAFKEESESQEEAGPSTPETTPGEVEATQEPELTMESFAETLQDPEALSHATEPSTKETTPSEGEATQEPELTMESFAEALQDPESTSEDSAPEPEIEPVPDLTLESAEEEPVEAIAPEEEPETESIPELTLESAEEEPEPVESVIQGEETETALELESLLEAAETPEEVEAIIAEIPLELELEDTVSEPESEPELVMEPQEETEVSAESTISPESLLDEENEQIWDDLLGEHEEEKQEISAETPVASTQEKEEGTFEDNDFWDQVLEKEESPAEENESEQQPVASAVPGTTERETLTDEELWKQAFPGEEDFEPTPAKHFDDGEEGAEAAPLVVEASITHDEEPEDSLKYDDAAYADYEDDDDEFEFERRKRKLGPFVIPHGRRGDLVIGGVMVVFLLLAGSVYFTLQTFAPGEISDMQTAKTEIPDGLTPREVPLDELAGDLISPKPDKTPPVDTPGDKGEATLSDPVDILKESPEEKGILKDLAESQILKDTGKSQTAKIDQSALQALSGHSVTMSTIMPVAYNPTDIRVLSFSVEIQLSDAKSAKRVRESLPVYEEIMNQAVEDFLRRKFYNDILYVKEKLQKRLQTAMSRSLKNGRVKKAKFIDFAIQ